ncbi:redoxin domain-containing protein [bacterium]|nr:redoxin domain-containing protein [bacterium]
MAVQPKKQRPSRHTQKAPIERGPSAWKWFGFLIPIAVVVGLIVIGSIGGEPGSDVEANPAPGFTLPTTHGTTVSLDGLLEDGDTLLYFSMGVGCDGCFAQIPEAAAGLQANGVQLVSVMVDSPERVTAEARRFGITSPILIDSDRTVSDAYGMLGVYGHADRPSHSFALVRSDGTVSWVKHYATMFVPLEQLMADMGKA